MQFPSLETEISISKNFWNSVIVVPTVERFSPKVDRNRIYVRITLNIKFHQILCINSQAKFATKFLSSRHFPEIIKSCSKYPKTCKSIKNRKSKIFTKRILSSIYIEESKNVTHNSKSLGIKNCHNLYISFKEWQKMLRKYHYIFRWCNS